MKIRITNPCFELSRAGIKAGDIVEATKGSELTGSMYFETKNGNRTFDCIAWPEEYEIVTEESITQ